MANSAAAKNSYHTRSISLPSRAHPQTANIEDQLCRLRSSKTTSTSSSSICHNLGFLNDLYESFDDILQLPHIQQIFSQGQWIEKSLDVSLRLLDICGMSKDALQIMKESLQKLESSLRRRKDGESGHRDEVQSFQMSRKNVKRIVNKCFKSMTKMEMFKIKMEIQGQNPEHVALLSIMREIEAVSLPVLRFILSFVFGTEAKSLLSKLIPSKRIGKQGEVMEMMVRALESLKGQRTEKIDLQVYESIIQELEDALECLFKRIQGTEEINNFDIQH